MVVHRQEFNLSGKVLNILQRISKNETELNSKGQPIHDQIHQYPSDPSESGCNRRQAEILAEVPGLVPQRIRGEDREDLFQVLDAIFTQ